MRITCLVVVSALVIGGCDEKEPAGPHVYFVPDRVASGDVSAAERWLLFPFPSDHRRTEEGRPDLSDFPLKDVHDIIDNYTNVIQTELTGFGNNSPVHLRFSEALDAAGLPTNADAYLSPDAPLQIIDVTEGSPEYGQTRPLRWEYVDQDGAFVAKNSLAVAPAWGFVLRENTTYAFLMTSAVKSATGKTFAQPDLLREALGLRARARRTTPAATAVFDSFAPLRAYLATSDRDANDIIAATVFTTQDITSDLAKIYRQVQEAPAPAYDENWRHPRDPASQTPVEGYVAEGTRVWLAPDVAAEYWIMEGQLTVPNYQYGDVPYDKDGEGGLRFDESGEPIVQRDETIRFVLTLPKDGPASGTCLPIVEYAHGTTGSAYSFINDGTAGRLAGRQIAGISIDQPMHGPRGMGESFDVELMSFNYFNPEAARMNFRQSAVDTFALTRFVKESLTVPADKSPTGEEVCFLTDKVSFFGHSHGGISGTIAAAYEDNIHAYMLSGMGGGLSITIFEREDYDIAGLIRELLVLGDSESLTELHPVITLAQTIVDITDPINYSPYWVHLNTHSDAKSMLVSSGERDTQTPYRTAAALAVAARIPNTLPVRIEIPEYDYLGIDAVDASGAGISNNISDNVTAGFMQFKSDGQDSSHWLIFRRYEAIGASMRFLQSAAYETSPVIARDPSSNAR